MKCHEVMTPNPSFCVPEDNCQKAARIMADRNVGPVPVVDRQDGRLVGIVTDRDLALKVVAKSSDPQSTRVADIMTTNLVTCHVDDSYDLALVAMARNQVRRVLIVDERGVLKGVISQADVARQGDYRASGDVLEEISRPGGNRRGMRSRNPEADRQKSAPAGDVLGMLICASLGAAAMFFLDPDRGSSRRAQLTSRYRM